VELFDLPGQLTPINELQGGTAMGAVKRKATTSGTVRFVLDGQVVAIEDVDPTRTVLNYLREDLGRTGT
jgi:hypothetical protein